MKVHWKNKYLYWGLTAFAVVGASMLFYFLLFRMDVVLGTLRKLISILMPIICGAIIAYLLIPIVNFQERHIYKFLIKKKHITPNKTQRKVIRYVGIVCALIFSFFIIYSLLAMIVPSIIESIISIINDSPRYFQNIRHWLESLLKDNPEWKTTVFSYVEQYSPRIENFLNDQILPQLRSILQHLSTGVFGTLVFLKNLLIGLIISVYLMAGKEEFVTQSKMFVYAFFSTEHANNVVKGVRFIHKTFVGFIIGKIIDSVIIGILCYIGTTIIGTPYALLVSVVVGVTNVIPFFGPYLGAIPTAFIILMVNPMQCLYFLIFILLLQQFDGNILGPKILGNSTGLSSFMVIVAILLFGGLMGVSGMIIGVPTLAVIMAGMKTFRAYNLRKKSMPMEEKVYTHMEYMNPKTRLPVDFAVDENGMDTEKEKRGRKQMKLVIQKVSSASVEVEGSCVGKIGKGFLVLVGIGKEDTREVADQFIKKMVNLRIFADENGKTNLSLADVNGEVLLVSQFTLYANCKKGNRPSFFDAGEPDKAQALYEYMVEKVKERVPVVQTGTFGAMMKVSLINEGPFTIILDENTFQ